MLNIPQLSLLFEPTAEQMQMQANLYASFPNPISNYRLGRISKTFTKSQPVRQFSLNCCLIQMIKEFIQLRTRRAVVLGAFLPSLCELTSYMEHKHYTFWLKRDSVKRFMLIPPTSISWFHDSSCTPHDILLLMEHVEFPHCCLAVFLLLSPPL